MKRLTPQRGGIDRIPTERTRAHGREEEGPTMDQCWHRRAQEGKPDLSWAA